MALAGEIICGYLDKYPDSPSLTLSKLIYKENKEAFSGVEAVRSQVRYYRGQQGERHLKKLATKKYLKPKGPYNPFENIPNGLKFYDEWEPFILNSKRSLILSDLHIPYHEREPLLLALEYGYKHNVDCILINGDFADFFACSFWEKDPRKRDLSNELQTCRSILGSIREGFPDAKIVFKTGNHEERYYRYLAVKAPELLGVDKFELASVLGLDDYDIDIVGDRRIIKFGKLSIIHGHEFGRTISSPVNPARGLYLKGKDTALCGHFHATSKHNERSMNGRMITCFSVACLCDLHPDYSPINKWGHGFAIVDRIGNGGEFEVWLKDIIENRIF